MRAGPHEIFWTGGDYISLYDYRVPYRWYVETLEFGQHRNKPVLQEDRFRVRNSDNCRRSLRSGAAYCNCSVVWLKNLENT